MQIFKNIVLTVLCAAMLAGVALAVPRGDLSEEIISQQVEETRDEELSFLDDLWEDGGEEKTEEEDEGGAFSWDDEEEDSFEGYFD